MLSKEYREAITDIVENILEEKAKKEPIDYIDWYRNTLPGRIIRIEENMATRDDIAVIKDEVKAIKYQIQNMATKDDIKNMAIKDDIESLKDSISSIKYWLSFGFAIIFFGLPFVIGLVMKLFGK